MRLYAWLAREIEPDAAPDTPYREWVDAYASPAFESLAATLEELLDRLGGDPEIVAGHYRSAMLLEVAFFVAAYNQAR
jgi:thiaminase/transcriptional activator TenA